nr:hypothetical protein [Tanacetum cinerariifolium]
MLKHFDREDLNQLWALVKETLNIRQATSNKEKELWVELKRLYEPDVEDQLWTQTRALMHDLCNLLSNGISFLQQGELSSLAVGTSSGSGNSSLAVGMP